MHDEPLVTTVIGAGVMGRGIAQVAALAGSATRLVDVHTDQLAAAMHAIGKDLKAGVQLGKLDLKAVGEAQERISTSTDLATGCQGAELVIEAVVEQTEAKRQVLTVAEGVAAADALLATNTSALSVTAIMNALDDPSRGVGMHFFNPVPRMALCELVRGEKTSAGTMDRADAAAKALGKQTVRVEDVAGFATSRINALIGAEAMRMLEDGVASAEDIDRAVKVGLKHPMGPLEMGDLVGWDTRLDILAYLTSELGDRFGPTELHRRLVAEGRLGRKVGHGVYRYDAQGHRILGT